MTSREFAKLLGVSQTTVSRALNDSDLVPEAKRLHIQKMAKEYGFVLNSHAKSLRTQRTETIGILFPKHFIGMNSNMMLAHVYDCIQRELHKYGYDIMVIYYSAEDDDFTSFERIIRTRKVDGFLVLRMELSPDEMELIREYQVPCVFLLNASAKIPPDLNYLFSDSEYGGYIAGEFLGEVEDDQKLFITLNEEREDAGRRLKGYRLGLESKGYILRNEDILSCNLSIESAYQCVMAERTRLIGRKTSIFAHNDILGIGAVSACRELGLIIPEQVQIISMDDIPLTQALRPQLSTLHVAVEEMVPQGCKQLIDLIRHEAGPLVQKWIKPSLILRETTK